MVIKMPSSDVAADHMSSSDSLSLTGLVCIQDQYSKSKPTAGEQVLQPHHLHRKTTKVSENDINFDFSYSAQSPAVAINLHKKSESKDLFDLKLNHLQPQTYGNVTMKDILEPRSNRRSRKSTSKKEDGNGISAKKTSTQVSKHGSKDHNNNGGFAHKVMQSITTPCRSCSAVEPSVAVVERSNMVQDI